MMANVLLLLLLFSLLQGSRAPAATWAWQAGEAGLGSLVARAADEGRAAVPIEEDNYYTFVPLVLGQPPGCEPIPGVTYGTLDVEGEPTDRPAELHADLNLALRGWEVTSAYLGLVDYSGGDDPAAPQLSTMFGDGRVPAFTAVYQVYNWDWGCNCRGDLLTYPEVTLAGMGVATGEVLRLPDSGYNIGDGYEALVLYATPERLTLKYTREDNVIRGYTIHLENICVEPSLLALYEEWNSAGRARLPALRGGQPIGRAWGNELDVAVRDTGTFMDPRARQSWWERR